MANLQNVVGSLFATVVDAADVVQQTISVGTTHAQSWAARSKASVVLAEKHASAVRLAQRAIALAEDLKRIDEESVRLGENYNKALAILQ